MQFAGSGSSAHPTISRNHYRTMSRYHPFGHHDLFFTLRQVSDTLSRSRSSTATVLDHLTILHLKRLGYEGIQYVTSHLFLSLRDAICYKSAIVIPILKLDKPLSFRFISLLCSAAKVLEKSTQSSNPPIFFWNRGYATWLHPLKSTAIALCSLVTHIGTGIN